MRKSAFLYIYFIISFILVCSIPYLFGESEPNQSLSYMVGFNNKVGMACLVLFSLPLLFFPLGNVNKIDYCSLERSNCNDKKFIIITILISAIFIILEGILLYNENYSGSGGEGAYVIRHIYAVKYGAELYGDIHYIYGPLTIYPVIWLSYLGITIGCSYFIVLLIYHVIGLFMIYDLLRSFNLTGFERRIIFVIAAIIFYPLATGLNFCSLRFVMLPWAIFHFIYYNKRHSFLYCSLFNICSFLFVFLYSQEFGLCYLFLVLLFSLIGLIVNKSWKDVVYFIEVLLVSCVVFIQTPNYFLSIIQAGSGGGSFPFIPSMAMLTVVIVFLVYGIFMGGQLKKIEKLYPLIVMELSFIIAFPSALGRCDPPHVFYNLFFAIVLCYVALGSIVQKRYVVLFVFIALLTFFPYHINYVCRSICSDIIRNNSEIVDKVLMKISPNTKIADKYKNELSKYNLLSLVDGSVTSINCDNKSYLLLQKKNFKETFFGYKPRWVGNKTGFDIEIESLKKANVDFLVLPYDYKTEWMKPADLQGHYVDILFCTYYHPKIKYYYNETLYGHLIEYIENNYYTIESNSSFTVLKRKI